MVNIPPVKAGGFGLWFKAGLIGRSADFWSPLPQGEGIKMKKISLYFSSWTLAEMASVGAIRERTGHIDAAGLGVGLAALYRFVSDSLTLSEVEPTDRRRAARHSRPGAACR